MYRVDGKLITSADITPYGDNTVMISMDYGPLRRAWPSPEEAMQQIESCVNDEDGEWQWLYRELGNDDWQPYSDGIA